MGRITNEDLGYITECVCIITDKVYAHCQQRECFPKVEVDIEYGDYKSIKFKPGFIVEGSLLVTDLPDRENFKRVRFTLRVPFIITRKGGSKFEGFLPDIYKDIVLFIPDHRDEFDFRIVVETSSELLDPPYEKEPCDIVTFAAGVFVIVKVVGRVQLLIPAFGFCPEPPECEDFQPIQDVCENFDDLPFPDFFPPQYEDLYPDA